MTRARSRSVRSIPDLRRGSSRRRRSASPSDVASESRLRRDGSGLSQTGGTGPPNVADDSTSTSSPRPLLLDSSRRSGASSDSGTRQRSPGLRAPGGSADDHPGFLRVRTGASPTGSSESDSLSASTTTSHNQGEDVSDLRTTQALARVQEGMGVTRADALEYMRTLVRLVAELEEKASTGRDEVLRAAQTVGDLKNSLGNSKQPTLTLFRTFLNAYEEGGVRYVAAVKEIVSALRGGGRVDKRGPVGSDEFDEAFLGLVRESLAVGRGVLAELRTLDAKVRKIRDDMQALVAPDMEESVNSLLDLTQQAAESLQRAKGALPETALESLRGRIATARNVLVRQERREKMRRARGGLVQRSLNVVGEDHVISGRRRTAEQFFVLDKIGTGSYWLEQRFPGRPSDYQKLDSTRVLPERITDLLAGVNEEFLADADPPAYRAAGAVADLTDRAQRVAQAAKEVANGPGGRLDRWLAEGIVDTRVRYLAEAIGREVSAGLHSRAGEVYRILDRTIAELSAIVKAWNSAGEGSTERSRVAHEVVVLSERLQKRIPGLAELVGVRNVPDAIQLDRAIRIKRSQSMMLSAMLSDVSRGVWKIGEAHIRDLLDGSAQVDLALSLGGAGLNRVNIVTRDEFEAGFAAWETAHARARRAAQLLVYAEDIRGWASSRTEGSAGLSSREQGAALFREVTRLAGEFEADVRQSAGEELDPRYAEIRSLLAKIVQGLQPARRTWDPAAGADVVSDEVFEKAVGMFSEWSRDVLETLPGLARLVRSPDVTEARQLIETLDLMLDSDG
jgi:hypothetical protein